MSRTYRALGWSFTVDTDDPDVRHQVESVLVDLEDDGRPEHSYVLTAPTPAAAGQLLVDGTPLVAGQDLDLLYRTLLWHINRGVVDSTTGHVLLHASAAADDEGRAVLMPAPMESGKTTLVAGLVRAGLQYLTDEAVALRPDDLVVDAYLKPLSVDPGSWQVLADLQPSGAVAHLQREQWQVPASGFGGVRRTAAPVVVVLPRYEEGAQTTLSPLSRAEALVDLLHSTFAPERAPERDFRALAELCRRCDCYRLVTGDLDEAVDLVRGALAD